MIPTASKTSPDSSLGDCGSDRGLHPSGGLLHGCSLFTPFMPTSMPSCISPNMPVFAQAFTYIHLFLTRVHLITYSREGGYPSSRFPGDSFSHLQRTVTSLPMWPVCTGRPVLREVESKATPKRLGIRWNQTVPQWLSPITAPLLVS